MIDLVKVLSVRAMDDYRLWVHFSDGRSGVCDLTELVQSDRPMLKPFSDPAFFARAFVQMGTVAWPNGFDIDAIALHQDMLAAGQLDEAVAG